MKFSIAILIAMSVFVQTTTAHAQTQSAAIKEYGEQGLAAYHGTFSETGVSGRAITDERTLKTDEALVIMKVILNRADSGLYGPKDNVKRVVYNKEYTGPKRMKQPWADNHAEQFRTMASVLEPIFQKWQKGEKDYMPARLAKYDDAWHTDYVPHCDWGPFEGKEGETFVYKKRNGPWDCSAHMAEYGPKKAKSQLASRQTRNKHQTVSNRKPKAATEVASRKPNGKTLLVVRNDNKVAPKPVSSARDLRVASR